MPSRVSPATPVSRPGPAECHHCHDLRASDKKFPGLVPDLARGLFPPAVRPLRQRPCRFDCPRRRHLLSTTWTIESSLQAQVRSAESRSSWPRTFITFLSPWLAAYSLDVRAGASGCCTLPVHCPGAGAQTEGVPELSMFSAGGGRTRALDVFRWEVVPELSAFSVGGGVPELSAFSAGGGAPELSAFSAGRSCQSSRRFPLEAACQSSRRFPLEGACQSSRRFPL